MSLAIAADSACAEAEKRSTTRFGCVLSGECRPADPLDSASTWPAHATNISRGGVNLKACRRFEPGTIIVLQFTAAALISYLTGLVIVASNSGMNSRIFNSTMVYDVLLVVVLGGIGLGGGRGGVRNVLVGTLLVGTLLSGMTIMNLPYATQNLIKSLVLLSALVADTFINPRDEQTSQQGDI